MSEREVSSRRWRARMLFVSVLAVAASGLVYELVASTVAAFFLGNAVVEFAIVLGVYLSAMGLGALLSGALRGPLVARFVELETLVALIGGTSAATLEIACARAHQARLLLYGDAFLVGVLVGAELPLLLRLLREERGFKDAVAEGLAVDYLGSLVAAALFPLVLMPTLGIVRTAALAGMLNAGVAAFGAALLLPTHGRSLRVASAVGAALALAVLVAASPLVARTASD